MQPIVPGATPPPHYVSFTAEINPSTAEGLIGLMGNLATQRVPEVHLMLSTPGGVVMSGITIYNALRAMPFKLITYNVGNVDSIGNAVFLAGEERYASTNATFMFHGVSMTVPAQTTMDRRFLTERMDSLVADERRIGAVFGERTNLTEADVVQLFERQQTKDADAALAAGIIHEVRDVQLPAGAPVMGLVFQR
ncbi:MAG: ATP-dependent Clp protease proteolytic subunit [Solirubrobacteraceae bacterium]|nr:ATP-dependent Clp protease proteolytic subunit [Solirubrobacteraceae bacterium]